MSVPNANHASEGRNLSDCMTDWLEERAGIREHDGRMDGVAAAWRDLLTAVQRGEDPTPLEIRTETGCRTVTLPLKYDVS